MEVKSVDRISNLENVLEVTDLVPKFVQEEKTNKKLNLLRNFVKRTTDIIISIFGVIALIPLTIVIYILRKIFKEEGPLFYEQLRIGKNGKHFRLYKFRTMIIGADEKLKQYLEENEDAKKEYEENHKLKDDPRITKLGKFLRKTSLDEIPQFINVLKGDMSLIGPRPIVDSEVPKFGDKIEIIHRVKPGITGYWAVNGRSNTTYEERVNMEVYYVENYSLKLDAQIFFKTVGIVLKKEGAI